MRVAEDSIACMVNLSIELDILETRPALRKSCVFDFRCVAKRRPGAPGR